MTIPIAGVHVCKCACCKLQLRSYGGAAQQAASSEGPTGNPWLAGWSGKKRQVAHSHASLEPSLYKIHINKTDLPASRQCGAAVGDSGAVPSVAVRLIIVEGLPARRGAKIALTFCTHLVAPAGWCHRTCMQVGALGDASVAGQCWRIGGNAGISMFWRFLLMGERGPHPHVV